jgi:protein-tyrosine phosphatase
VVDIHCHIVPGVDDGSPDVETSLAMIRQAKAAGVTAILTTPHIRANPADRPVHEIHKQSFAALRDAHASSDVRDVQIQLGGEVRVTGDTLRIIDDPIFTSGERQKSILLELSSQEVPSYFPQVIFEFRLRGITPIVAHPERNLAVLKRPKYALDFVRQGALLQLTTSSVNGELGPTIESAALAMLRAGIVSIVASDAHNLTSRPFSSWNRTKTVINELPNAGPTMFDQVCTANPQAIFEGRDTEPIDVSDEMEKILLANFTGVEAKQKEKRKRFFFF